MSLQIEIAFSVPKETQRVARASFPKGNLYMTMRDQLGPIFRDEQFLDLFPPQGQPAEAPWRLALVTLMQFTEGLPDRQAADAVRSRIDWKYALGLELEDPGFDSSVLSEFRSRLVEHGTEDRLFETLLSCFNERKLLKKRGRQRTDSTHVLAAVRTLNRLEFLGETLRHALNELAEIDPEWLSSGVPSDWWDRYGKRIEHYRLPKEKAERDALALQIGADGFFLLEAAYGTQSPQAVREAEAVEIVRRVWVQQFTRHAADDRPDRALSIALRTEADLPPGAVLIRSPYDLEARLSVKRETIWTGYKVHLTETCDPEIDSSEASETEGSDPKTGEEDAPHLITQVVTTLSTTADSTATEDVHQAMKQSDRLPGEHFVDEGYTDAHLLVSSPKTYGVELVGPVAKDGSRQATEGQGFDVSRFEIDFENQVATCPAGEPSERWRTIRNARGAPVFRVVFPQAVCGACEYRGSCTRAQTTGRTLYVHPDGEHQALHHAREQQKTAAFRERYAVRAGIEGTISQGVRAFGLRRSRYIGQAKTHLQNLMIAAAINLCRYYDWICGIPRAKTRTSAFARLKPSLVPIPSAA